jgi:hypothetical protein
MQQHTQPTKHTHTHTHPGASSWACVYVPLPSQSIAGVCGCGQALSPKIARTRTTTMMSELVCVCVVCFGRFHSTLLMTLAPNQPTNQPGMSLLAHSRARPARLLALLLLLLVVLLVVQPARPLLLLGRTKEGKEEERKEEATAASIPDMDMDDGKPADWTRSQQQHQRPGRRRLESHVDGEEALNLLQHEPVKLTLGEAQDWQHVKRRLSEAREKSGFFHRVADAFVPPNSALRRKEREAGDAGLQEELEEVVGVAEGTTHGSGKGAEQEFKIFDHFHRLKRREQAQAQQGRVGLEV